MNPGDAIANDLPGWFQHGRVDVHEGDILAWSTDKDALAQGLIERMQGEVAFLCGVPEGYLQRASEKSGAAIILMHEQGNSTFKRWAHQLSSVVEYEAFLVLTLEVLAAEAREQLAAMRDAGLRKVDAILFGTDYEDWLEASPERRSDLAFYGGKRWSNGISAGCLPARPLVLNRIAEPHAYPKRNHGV